MADNRKIIVYNIYYHVEIQKPEPNNNRDFWIGIAILLIEKYVLG